MERMEAVKATGLADKVIVEEYEGQKIDDIKRYGADIFTVGSDWEGKFDYLNEYCKVIYLPRTEGVSSTELRSRENRLRIGIVGQAPYWAKFVDECSYVNGIQFTGICAAADEMDFIKKQAKGKQIDIPLLTDDYDALLAETDAVYVVSRPDQHYEEIKHALLQHKHVLCEAPITTDEAQTKELFTLADAQGCVLMEAIKTAYATAYERVLLVAKSGRIGKSISVDATCTSLSDGLGEAQTDLSKKWNSISAWGPTALLPVFQLLGTDYKARTIVSKYIDVDKKYDGYTKIDFIYPSAVASIRVAKAAKAEGELIITGEKGYIYVPAPWWKTDYFEVRFENPQNNLSHFYQLDGEGIRYEVVAFTRSIETKKNGAYIDESVSLSIARIIQDCRDYRSIVCI